MNAKIDRRFSDPSAAPTPWATTETALQSAELYWITTVREDGRPHVTPLIGLWHDGASTSAPACASRSSATWSTTTASR